MGQLVDLHTQLQGLLAQIKAEAGVPLRVYDTPPVQLPELPCVFLLTPDEDFTRLDTETGERSVTVVIRLIVAATKSQTELLALADTLIDVADIWLWDDPLAPLDRARRLGTRGVTPVFGDVPTRGADFPISVQMLKPIPPAP